MIESNDMAKRVNREEEDEQDEEEEEENLPVEVQEATEGVIEICSLPHDMQKTKPNRTNGDVKEGAHGRIL